MTPSRRILFAHGAGLPSSSDWMRRWARRLGVFGEVTRFDYPYVREGRKRPDPMKRLVEAHAAELSRLSQRGDEALVLAGKSMGSRVGCHLSIDQDVAALVCFGYPLVGASKKRPVRDAVLLDLRSPVLFIQGTRDRLCPLDLLAEVRARMRAPSTLHVVDGGDHSLIVGKRALAARGQRQQDVDAEIQDAVGAFLNRIEEVRTRSG